jgi:hypothetical protein
MLRCKYYYFVCLRIQSHRETGVNEEHPEDDMLIGLDSAKAANSARLKAKKMHGDKKRARSGDF